MLQLLGLQESCNDSFNRSSMRSRYRVARVCGIVAWDAGMNMDKMRERFEAWARKTMRSERQLLWLADAGAYENRHTQWEWMAWQAATRAAVSAGLPIETAPKEGTEVLLYWRGAGWMRGKYVVDDRWDIRPRGWLSPYQGWRNDGDQVIPRNQDDCTHWMPFPPAPEEKT